MSFSRGYKGNSRAWRLWSTGAVANGDRNTGLTGKQTKGKWVSQHGMF